MDAKGYIWILLAGSFFEMWAAGTICDIVGKDNCKDEIGFALSLGVISLFICVVMAVLNFFMEPPKILDMIVSACLFVLWFMGIMVGTFYKPFATMCVSPFDDGNGGMVIAKTANGYVTMWLCFLASGAYMMNSIEFLSKLMMRASPQTTDGAILSACGMASIVAMCQAAYLCDNAVPGYGNDGTGGCDSAHAWVIIWGVISFVVCALMMVVGALAPFKKYTASVLCIGWILTVLSMCFVYKDNHADKTGIFKNAGNGFFALWLGLLTSFAMAWCGWSGMEASEAFSHAGVFVPVIFVASFFEFWASIVLCDKMNGSDDYGSSCKDEYAFAVVAGIVGMVLSFTQLMLRIFLKDFAAKTQLPIAVSLWLWWVVSLAVVCFKHPFTSMCSDTGSENGSSDTDSAHWRYDGGDPSGYIATWIAVFASTLMLMENETISNLFTKIAGGAGADGAYLSPLIMCSLVVMAQGAYDCDNRSNPVGLAEGQAAETGCTSYQGFAVSVGVISTVVALILMFVSALKDFAKFVYAFLAAWWFVAVAVLTFTYKDQDHSGEFAVANNGFFGCWGGFFISCLCVYISWVDPNFSLTAEPEGEGEGEAKGDEEPKSDAPGVEANPTAGEPEDGEAADAEGVVPEVAAAEEPETAKV